MNHYVYSIRNSVFFLRGVTGEYTPPQGYFVDEDEAEDFDKRFSYKEKLKLPGQLF